MQPTAHAAVIAAADACRWAGTSWQNGYRERRTDEGFDTMTITLPVVAGVLLSVAGVSGLLQAVANRVGPFQRIGLALFSASFLCMGLSSATRDDGSGFSAFFSISGAVLALLGFARVQFERRKRS